MGVLAPAGAETKSPAEGQGSDHTSATEARRVDSVPTPKLAWQDCGGGAQCATVQLPLDYDEPNGAKTKVGLLRRPARDQVHRIGSLFVNPGGPGGSGTGFVRDGAPTMLSPGLMDRFDVVGVDPRGMNLSDQVKCFTSSDRPQEALKGFGSTFPVGKVEEQAYIAAARNLGVGCSSTGAPLSASMSTAEVARDMDVLRRAVGDSKLTFLGFSYGSYLGQVYANMFPDRLRALTIDGVLDPIAWVGTPATASRPQTDRLRSADGATKSLRQFLSLCDRAGIQKCKFAAGGAAANYDILANRLKKTPLMLVPEIGLEFTYAMLVEFSLGALKAPGGFADIDPVLSRLMILTKPSAGVTSRATRADRSKATRELSATLKAQEAKRGKGFGVTYSNSRETLPAVLCTDGSNPRDAASWSTAAAAADKRAKYFGRFWAWVSAPCASATWTARDEDAYSGPFNRRTASPILVVGSTWDPATNYEGALKAASLLPNSRLLSSDNWGHLAYPNSRCAASVIDTYLLTQVLPARGTMCHAVQPFQDNPVSVSPVAPRR
jgi:pimeloyl-ACP methyl ester carboxylesterase